MSKLGDSFQELVGNVARAVDPNAEVSVGDWVVGPDGRRDIDVSVRDPAKRRLVMIECKDWKGRVGIEEVDKLDSKRRDLNAQVTIICSNSGFTDPALRKADRVGIGAVSVLVAGSDIVKFQVHREIFAKRLSVDRWVLNVLGSERNLASIPDPFDARDLQFEGLPIVNWLSKISKQAIHENEFAAKIVLEFAFRGEKLFTLKSAEVLLAGLHLQLFCSRKWYSQLVRENLSAGFYDHIRGLMVVPNNQAYILGPFVKERWQETEEPAADYQSTFSISIETLLFNQIEPVPGRGIPDLDKWIQERKTTPS